MAKQSLKPLTAIFDGVQVKSKKFGPAPSLVTAVKMGGSDSYVGWINHAGRVSDGTFQVQFDISGNGWSSRWPEWAYDVARAALTSGKKVWVISNGVPYGTNLLQVLMLN